MTSLPAAFICIWLTTPPFGQSKANSGPHEKIEQEKPTWTDLKRQLADLDRPALLGLIQDLYAASKSNQAFLHARFALGEDVLEPYKTTIDRWVCPGVMRNQDSSVAKAKKAISDYKKAIGRPEGLAELTVFYCESCMNLLGYCGMDDEGYFNALVRMFEQALKAITALEPDQQEDFVERLERVRHEGHNWGWGVGDDMDDLMAEYGFAEQ
ncbi:hypothetical protein [Desulfofustis limnaeus]|jgi:hypothetical protein|uniref:Uncharacterized protein n=1 Tax=Desulfofustis limnaeus TaxID=2740163 RepID=A0ABM7WE79_9BACT|nr:hypothetical protein [Desulfofustis limnaeus]MDX9895538.1 hypothetical protein [Desulfofustis sp.]BDD89274.1 hypothetical protein DPPLL_36390 [Desulfofustis limnaeus]